MNFVCQMLYNIGYFMGTIYGDILWGRTQFINILEPAEGNSIAEISYILYILDQKNGPLHHELTYFLLRI